MSPRQSAGLSELARRAGLNRAGLSRALATRTTPRIDTVTQDLKSLRRTSSVRFEDDSGSNMIRVKSSTVYLTRERGHLLRVGQPASAGRGGAALLRAPQAGRQPRDGDVIRAPQGGKTGLRSSMPSPLEELKTIRKRIRYDNWMRRHRSRRPAARGKHPDLSVAGGAARPKQLSGVPGRRLRLRGPSLTSMLSAEE